MKKRIFVAFVVLAAAFAMVGCPTGDTTKKGPSGDGKVSITFNLNYEGAAPPTVIKIDEGTSFNQNVDPNATPTEQNPNGYYTFLPQVARTLRPGKAFTGWFTAGNVQATIERVFDVDTTLYAHWVDDILTLDDEDDPEDIEILYLTNGAYALYQFDIPTGQTLAAYSDVSFDVKVSAGALAVWDGGVGGQVRGIRLYGVFTANDVHSLASNSTTYGLDEVRFLNANTYNVAGYILQNPGQAGIRSQLEANEWHTITHSLSNALAAATANRPGTQTGTVYLALGISCQNTSGGTDRSQSFIQLVKNVTLKQGEGTLTVAGKVPELVPAEFLRPAVSPGHFMAYQDPMVFEWRAPYSANAYENWETLRPNMPTSTWSREGAPSGPTDSALAQVELFNTTKYVHTATTAPDPVTPAMDGFTYVNKGNPNRQRGWTSFTEAGQSNDQIYNGGGSIVPFENFKNAWYLVLETTAKPTGGGQIIWMGGAGGWNSNAIFDGNNGSGINGVTVVEKTAATGFTITIPLTSALGQYERFYKVNDKWATFCIQYYGANRVPETTPPYQEDFDDLGVTAAYLLVKTSEKVADVTEGIAATLSFKLTDAPASGDLIKDVVLDKEGTTFEVTTAAGLTDFRWYVDGVAPASTALNTEGDTLTLTVATTKSNKVITVQAKRGTAWVSQTVFVTIN